MRWLHSSPCADGCAISPMRPFKLIILSAGAALSSFIPMTLRAAPVDAPAAQQYGRPRFALVIANSAYVDLNPLPNAETDGKLVKTALEQRGFNVTKFSNLAHSKLRTAINAFFDGLPKGVRSTVIVYFTGHGFQINNVNYILPVDQSRSREKFRPEEVESFNDLFGSAARSHAYPLIVIIDACRKVPEGLSTNDQRGFARFDPPAEAFLGLSTAFNSVALDGVEGQASPFARAFVDELDNREQKIEDFFRQITAKVTMDTGGVQHPTYYSGISEPFFPNRDHASLGDALFYAGSSAYAAVDMTLATQLYQLAAKQGSLKALTMLGTMSYEGTSNEPGIPAAIRYFRRSVISGKAYDREWLAAALIESTKEAERREGEHAISSLAESGSLFAKLRLGIQLSYSHDSESVRRGVSYLEEANAAGSPVASLELGNVYMRGRGDFPADRGKAFVYWKLAADRGQPLGFTYLGEQTTSLRNGAEDNKRDGDALVSFERAVAEDEPIATFYLGVMYALGRGVKVDRNRAIGYFDRCWRLSAGILQAVRYRANSGMMGSGWYVGPRDLSAALAQILKEGGSFTEEEAFDLKLLKDTHRQLSGEIPLAIQQ